MNRVQKHNIRYYETSPTAISSTEWLFWCLPDNPLDSGRCDGVTVISQLSLEWHTHTERETHRLFHQSFSQTQTKSNGFCVCVCWRKSSLAIRFEPNRCFEMDDGIILKLGKWAYFSF